jgi:hypothetical protein
MLGRYIGGTLLILGGAMLLAPEAEQSGDRAEAGAPRDAVGILAPGPAAAPEAPVMAEVTRASTARPADLDTAVASAAASLAAPERDGADMLGSESQPLGLAAPRERTLEDLVQQARVDGTSPSLANPEGFGAPAMTAETQALIARADAAEPDRVAAHRSDETLLYVTGSRVNLRAGPSTGNAVVGSVSYGDAVEVLDYANDNWAQIRFGDRIAFMSRNFLASDLGDG